MPYPLGHGARCQVSRKETERKKDVVYEMMDQNQPACARCSWPSDLFVALLALAPTPVGQADPIKAGINHRGS